MATEILGNSRVIRDMVAMIDKVAPTSTSILIVGESGTGKELVARMIHEKSLAKDGPFVAVNCGAIPETLIESELFGHVRGSFTGAVSDKPGLFEVAGGGTIFLDEIGELPLSMQVKLLRALQDRRIRRVGGNNDMAIDVRVISATNRDLQLGITRGTFREDLFFRLNVIQIRTPPLRERGSDIELLASAFMKKYSAKQNKKLREIDSEAVAALRAHSWPGNVRELENCIERAVALEPGDRIRASSLPIAVTEDKGSAGSVVPQGELSVPAPDYSNGPLNLEKILGNVERAYLEAALKEAGGVRKKAAALVGLTFRSFRYRLQKLGVDTGDQDE